ncbi:hypothetical protein FACS189426_02670 [Bacteroidia bacterium]|nr:hypothetical protein FACS189426_02670 [Bacteroidia bacterium]
MKQLFYIIAVIVLMIFAQRLMTKIKDVPKEEEPVDYQEDLEDFKDESSEEINTESEA